MKTRKILCMTYRPGSAVPSVNEEPCQGDCYAYDDVLCIKGGGWTPDEIRVAMQHLLGIHAKICGNANYRLGIDFVEGTEMFIGTFYRFGALDTVAEWSVQATIEALVKTTSEYFASAQFAADQACDAGLGRAACAHGDEVALKSWMAKVGGFDVELLGERGEG